MAVCGARNRIPTESDLFGVNEAVIMHPRMCGEKIGSLSSLPNFPGSPPHVRGKDSRTHSLPSHDGFTPACAGKRVIMPPHSMLWYGSPPHVRGKDHTEPRTGWAHRFTPACAGKRSSMPVPVLSSWVHPRMCGEKPPVLDGVLNVVGSPPHVRGKVTKRVPATWRLRFTPACAGKSRKCQPDKLQWPVHPRMCGEKAACCSAAICAAGSPPHVRGKGHRRGSRATCRRFTPACAGKRQPCARSLSVQRVHPRMCGEKSGSTSITRVLLGSPPHVRGKAKCTSFKSN